jgi:putative ABC transport system permease protein
MHGDVARKDTRATGIEFVPGAANPVTEQLDQVVLVLMVALLVLAAVNALLIAWAAALDALRSTALARALGATPWQVTAGLSAAQLFPAAAAAVLGIPLGVLVYDAARAAGGASGRGSILYGWLPAVVSGTLAVVALLTAVPIRAAGRRPVAQVLGAD